MRYLIHNAQVITLEGVIPNGWLLWSDRLIQQIGTTDDAPPTADHKIDANGAYLAPGFIDLHVHGAVGFDTMDASLDGLLKQAEFFARHGVTSFLPTTLTNTRHAISDALHVIQNAMATDHRGATIWGAYVEGPYLNADKAGAQNPEHIRRVDQQEALEWLDTGIVKVMTIAPEFSESEWLIRACAARGITVTAAHTDATYADMRHAIDLGLSQITHTFNGMRGFHHREPSLLGAAAECEAVYCEVIADNLHVHPAAINVLWKLKGDERSILITDSTRATGMPDGEYDIGGQILHLQQGESRLADGTLAGSVTTMDTMVANFAKIVGDLTTFWKATSYNAACQIGIQDQTGSLGVGKLADLVMIDADYRVNLTVVQGNIVFSRDADKPATT